MDSLEKQDAPIGPPVNALQKLDDATRMLAEVRTADDAKQLMDLAGAAEHYARKHKLGEQAIQHAHAIKIEASAMLGKFIQAEVRAGRRPANSPHAGELPAGVTFNASVEHQLLASVKENSPEEFEAIKTGEKTVTQIKREIVKAKAIEKVRDLPSGKYRVIYADPPWKYGDTLGGDLSENYGGAEKHYPALTIGELCALPVRDISDDNAVLFLWVTSPLLFESAHVVQAWGFQYKSAFVWDKVKHNMGHYNSVRHELLLICTRGSCTPDVNKLFDSVQSIERTDKHSQKPEEFRQIIDTLYPFGERIELFARGELPQPWKAWGAEVVVSA